ncbi:MAG: sensor domain-containing diguanylate cyclase [Lachnospiraceae bacterium]|nr:sensor domain-containing diguanylate cyclase [Lachnospiraceae bacterium]
MGSESEKKKVSADGLRFFILSILVIVFFVSIVFVYYRMVYSERLDRIFLSGEKSALKLADKVEKYLSVNFDSVRFSALAVEDMIKRGCSDDEIQEYLVGETAAIRSVVEENATGLYGYINGRFFSGTRWEPPADFVPTERPWYLKPMSEKGVLTMLEPYQDAQTGAIMLAIGKTLRDGESVISVDVSLDRIQDITEDAVKSKATDMQMILNQNGMVITHSDRGEIGKEYGGDGGAVGDVIFNTISHGENDYFECKYDGSHYIVYVTDIGDNWKCISVIDATETFNSLKLFLLGTVAIIIIMVIVISIILISSKKRSDLAKRLTSELSTTMNSVRTMNEQIENLTEEVMQDKLTGFYNKVKGSEKIGEICSTQKGALMVIDLDNFKLVNDLYGHDMGDKVLCAFADILRGQSKAGDVISRIGGDEFMLFSNSFKSEDDVAAFTKNLNTCLVDRCKVLLGTDFDIPIGVSVGTAFAPEHANDFDRLFEYADSSMYLIKNKGKHDCCVYRHRCEENESEHGLDTELLRLTQIIEERREGKGAFLLGMEDFTITYRYIMRYIRRYGKKTEKAIISVDMKAGSGEKNAGSVIREFACILQKSFRSSDIIMQYKDNCFVLLLPGMENCTMDEFMSRVMDTWNLSQYKDFAEIRYISTAVNLTR